MKSRPTSVSVFNRKLINYQNTSINKCLYKNNKFDKKNINRNNCKLFPKYLRSK